MNSEKQVRKISNIPTGETVEPSPSDIFVLGFLHVLVSAATSGASSYGNAPTDCLTRLKRNSKCTRIVHKPYSATLQQDGVLLLYIIVGPENSAYSTKAKTCWYKCV